MDGRVEDRGLMLRLQQPHLKYKRCLILSFVVSETRGSNPLDSWPLPPRPPTCLRHALIPSKSPLLSFYPHHMSSFSSVTGFDGEIDELRQSIPHTHTYRYTRLAD